MSSQTASNYQATQNNTNLSPDGPLEKDYGNGYHLDNNMDADTALKKIQTSGSISISPELFEKIYLSPQNKVAGDLRKTFGNPTPLALVGFLLSLTPLSCDLMGWRGAGPLGNGSAGIGAYFFFGGLLMVLGGLGEFILGNTFPFIVFCSFGAFWLTFAATLQPFYSAFENYAMTPVGGSAEPSEAGLDSSTFNAAFGFFLVFMGVLCFLYMILALRTNLVFFLIFLFLVPAFSLLANAFFMNASNYAANQSAVATQLKAAGALAFVVCILGWYIWMAIMLAALDFPFQLPVVDLSRFVKGASERKKAQDYEQGMGA